MRKAYLISICLCFSTGANNIDCCDRDRQEIPSPLPPCDIVVRRECSVRDHISQAHLHHETIFSSCPSPSSTTSVFKPTNSHPFDVKKIMHDNCELIQPVSFSVIQLDFWALTEKIPKAKKLFRSLNFFKWQQDLPSALLDHSVPSPCECPFLTSHSQPLLKSLSPGNLFLAMGISLFNAHQLIAFPLIKSIWGFISTLIPKVKIPQLEPLWSGSCFPAITSHIGYTPVFQLNQWLRDLGPFFCLCTFRR